MGHAGAEGLQLLFALLAFFALSLFVDYFDFNVDLWFLLHAVSSN
jgi:hypothetical protein